MDRWFLPEHCLPSKNIIYSAHVAALFRHSVEFGITPDTSRVDTNIIRGRKRQMVDDLVDIHRNNSAGSAAEQIMGEGRFVALKTIEVLALDGSTRVLTGDRVYLNVGTRAAIPDVLFLGFCRLRR